MCSALVPRGAAPPLTPTDPPPNPDPQTTPRAGHSTIIAPTERARNPAITSPHTRRLPPPRPGASLSSPPSPKATGRSTQELALLAPGWALAGRWARRLPYRAHLRQTAQPTQHCAWTNSRAETRSYPQVPSTRGGLCPRATPGGVRGGWGTDFLPLAGSLGPQVRCPLLMPSWEVEHVHLVRGL